MVSCGSKIIKLLLGVFNLLWLILGGGVLYVGVQLLRWNHDFNGAADLANIDLKTASFAILSIGAVIALISFLGFFGACCENTFMLNAYGFLLVLMIAAQIYALVYSINHNGSIENGIIDGIRKAIHEINKNYQTAYALGLLQYNLKCCGWTSAIDYRNTTDTGSISTWLVPSSCCGVEPKHADRSNGQCASNDPKLFTDGCDHKLHIDEIGKIFKTSIGVCVAVVMFEVILIFAACCLAREFRN